MAPPLEARLAHHLAEPASSGVTIHHEEQLADDGQEWRCSHVCRWRPGHWAPLAEGEIVVVSAGKLIEREGRQH
jgi:hypothetical protein